MNQVGHRVPALQIEDEFGVLCRRGGGAAEQDLPLLQRRDRLLQIFDAALFQDGCARAADAGAAAEHRRNPEVFRELQERAVCGRPLRADPRFGVTTRSVQNCTLGGPWRSPLPLGSVLKEGFERKSPRICRLTEIHVQTNVYERLTRSIAYCLTCDFGQIVW